MLTIRHTVVALVAVTLIGLGADMALPVLTVSVAFGDNWNDASPTWTDVTADVRADPGVRIRRGRRSRLDRMPPGELSVVLDNRDRAYDPLYAAGAHYGDLVPMTPIRVQAVHNTVTYTLFRGLVAEWPVAESGPRGDSTVTVRALDGLTMLALDRTRSRWRKEVEADSPGAWYQFNDTTGILTDSTDNGYDGTGNNIGAANKGITGPGQGFEDLAWTFDGVNGYVDLPKAAGISGTGVWAVEAVLKTTTTGYFYFFDQTGAVNLYPYLVMFVGPPYQGVTVEGHTSVYGDGVTLHTNDPINDGEWHHVIVTHVGSGEYNIYVDGALYYNDTDAAVTLAPENITISSPTANGAGTLSELIIYPSAALSAAQAAAHYEALVTPLTLDTPTQRVTEFLDDISWQSALRDLDTTTDTMEDWTDSPQSAYDAILTAAATEGGLFYVAKDGDATLENRHARDVSTLAATYSDDGSDTPYTRIGWELSDLDLRTAILVSNKDGTQTRSASANVSRYGRRVYGVTSHNTSKRLLKDQADWLATSLATPRVYYTVTQTLGAGHSDALWAELLSRELSDLVNLERLPIGGGARWDEDTFVEEIRITISPKLWEQTLWCSPATGQRSFVLDDATIGELDGVGLLGW